MSFIKITDTKKRDFMVNKFLTTRPNIQQKFLSEHVGDLNYTIQTFEALQTSYEPAKRIKIRLWSEMKPIKEGMKNLPKAITFPQHPSITTHNDDSEEDEDAFIGETAEQYLRKFASVSGADKIFGLLDNDGTFYVGNKETKIKENNIFVVDMEYTSTPGLSELIVAITPDDKIFSNGDYDNYAEIVISTNALT